MKTKSMLLKALVVLLLAPAAFGAAGERMEIPLWPGGAPGSEGKSGAEAVRVTPSGEHVVSNVHKPSLTPFLPTKDKATSAAVIVIPGGGHRELWMDHEGYNVAQWLSDRGTAAFVLKHHLACETNSIYKIDVHAFADTQRAVRGMARGQRLSEIAVISRGVGVPANAEISQIRLGSARASRAAWGASPQSRTFCFHHTVGSVDAEPVGAAPTGTREGACAPHDV